MATILSDYERWMFDIRNLARKTRRHYLFTARATDRWLVEHRHVHLDQANLSDLKAFLATRSRHSPTRNRIRTALACFYDHLTDTGRRDDNPARQIPRLKEPRPLPKALPWPVCKTILAAARAHHPMWHAYVALLLFTGLRRNEARTLDWTAFEGDRWLRFVAKGDKERVVWLHDRAREALLLWRPQCPNPRWVFPSPIDTQPISGATVRTHLLVIGEVAGVRFTPHIGRHSFATRLLELGVDVRTVQEALGHDQLSSTQIYLSVRPQRVADAVALLD